MISENFIDAIRPLLKDDAELKEYLDAAQKPLKKSVKLVNQRVQPGGDYSTLREKFLSLTDGDWSLTPTVFDELHDQYYIDRENREMALGRTVLHLGGFFYIQEVAASIPANFLDIPEGGKVLDVCAAPGGKSIQLADRLLAMNPKNPGLVRGNDVDRKRLQTRGTNINRTGMYNTLSTQFDGSAFGNLFPEFFDAVLVDAPCSGEGTGFKSDSALKRRKQESINKVAATQEHILTASIKATKVGGSIIYSTCTLNHTENESMIKKILEKYGDSMAIEDVILAKKNPGLESYKDEKLLEKDDAEKCVRCRPHLHHTGGFFVCKLRKTAPILSGSQQKKEKAKKKGKGHNSQYMTYISGKKLTKEVHSYLMDQFGIEIDEESHAFVSSQSKVYCVSPAILDVINTVPIQKIGVPILKRTRDGFRPLHNLGQLFGTQATKNLVRLSDEQMQDYVLHKNLEGDDLAFANTAEGNSYVVVLWNDFGMSVGKRVGSVLKNKFFKRGG